jgi:glycosyltransferase involved in cell wall biosynthesis
MLFVGNFLSATLNRTYSEELADRLEARGWRIIRTSAQVPRDKRLADMLWTTWNRRREYELAHVDVFSGAAFAWAEATCLLLRALRKPYVLTLRGGNLPAFAARWPRRVRALLRSAAAVTAPSKYLLEHLDASRRDTIVLPNAVDTAAYGFRPRVEAAPRLVWMRAFHAIYNPVMAIDVLAKLTEKWPTTTLDMIGPDKDGSLARVEQRARALRIHGRLNLVGQIPKSQVARHLASADVFINTTDIDNTPVSVLEAMAAGLCVVSTSVGGIPFMLTSERDALLVPPRDVTAMAAALERILEEPDLAERLSRTGHETALRCDWSQILTRWEATFESLA